MKVSKETALFFKDQLVGQSNGHMASIPNNPVLFSLLSAYDATSGEGLAEFLEDTAAHIKKEAPF